MSRSVVAGVLSLCSLVVGGEWALVELSNRAISDPVPPDFVGWSIEHIHGSLLLRRPQFAQLMRNLQEINAARGPNIRLGGNSAEYCAYRPDPSKGLAGMPAGVKRLITDDDVRTYARAIPQWRGSMIVGLNFLNSKSSELAVNHVRALQRLMPEKTLEAVEVGNEVDMFRRHYRKLSYDYWAYLPEFRAYVTDILSHTHLGMPRIRGPSLAMPTWYEHADHYAERFGPGGTGWLRSMSAHWYGLSACGGAVVTIPLLLSEGVVAYPLLKIAKFAASARAAGLHAHLGETNTVACSGREGVSDTFAAALWALDWLMGLARLGMSRVNFHGGPAYSYTAFAVDMHAQRDADRARAKARAALKEWRQGNAKRAAGRKGNQSALPNPPRPPAPDSVAADPPITVRPLYYGALVFTAATKNGATLLVTTVHTNGYQSNQSPELRLREDTPYVTAYATRSASNCLRVVVLNKAVLNVTGPVSDVFVRVALPEDGVREPGTKRRLRVKGGVGFLQMLAPPARGAVESMYGVTWSGQTFDGSTDGLPRGTKHIASLPLQEGRYFHFHLPPASAALLTVFTETDKGGSSGGGPRGGDAHSPASSANGSGGGGGSGKAKRAAAEEAVEEGKLLAAAAERDEEGTRRGLRRIPRRLHSTREEGVLGDALLDDGAGYPLDRMHSLPVGAGHGLLGMEEGSDRERIRAWEEALSGGALAVKVDGARGKATGRSETEDDGGSPDAAPTATSGEQEDGVQLGLEPQGEGFDGAGDDVDEASEALEAADDADVASPPLPVDEMAEYELMAAIARADMGLPGLEGELREGKGGQAIT